MIYLIKPSRYDDDGYVVRHLRGVIPSNTLMTMHALTRHAADNGELGDVAVDAEIVDEAVQRVPYKRIRREGHRPGTRVLIALCGVQTNQFPRARDLARRFRAGGEQVMIGGFHVSGANALVPGIAPELRELLDVGVYMVRGEVDDCWGRILAGFLAGDLPLLVDRMADKPDLSDKPIPLAERRYLRRFTMPDMGTIDAGRGCPFNCSFCTIINVQGRTMRARSPQTILEAVRRQYARGTRFYFFTDDNFARHPHWGLIFDGLAALRAQGYDITFMMQVDTQATRLEGFVRRARKAGCVQVFIGIESLRSENLLVAGKRQNKTTDFRGMIDDWHAEGIVTHCAYILGFPHDTPATIAQDVRRLRDEIDTDLASFFILMPLPGSADHHRLATGGAHMDADLNQYDSFHAVTDHPAMSRADWERAYRDAWSAFYTLDHMKRCLRRFATPGYWTLFHNFVWCRNAAAMGEHPMMSGFYRLRDRTERRPGWPLPTRLAHLRMRVLDARRQLAAWWRLALEMEEVWLATRRRSPDEGKVKSVLIAALSLKPRTMLANLTARFHRDRRTRADLTAYWRQFARLHWFQANPLRSFSCALHEWAILTHFLVDITNPGTQTAVDSSLP